MSEVNTALLDKMDAAYRRLFLEKNKRLTCEGFYLEDGEKFNDDNKDESRDFFPGIGAFGFYDPDGPFVKISREVFDPSLCVYLVQFMLAQFDIYMREHETKAAADRSVLVDAGYASINATVSYITQSHKDGIIKCDDDYWYWGSK
jgi:hypothetical protein